MCVQVQIQVVNFVDSCKNGVHDCQRQLHDQTKSCADTQSPKSSRRALLSINILEVQCAAESDYNEDGDENANCARSDVCDAVIATRNACNLLETLLAFEIC